MVAVLEPQIDLLGRHVHEGDILEILSDTNDENHTSETSGLEMSRVSSFGDAPVILMGLTYVYSCMDTALHTFLAQVSPHKRAYSKVAISSCDDGGT